MDGNKGVMGGNKHLVGPLPDFKTLNESKKKEVRGSLEQFIDYIVERIKSWFKDPESELKAKLTDILKSEDPNDSLIVLASMLGKIYPPYLSRIKMEFNKEAQSLRIFFNNEDNISIPLSNPESAKRMISFYSPKISEDWMIVSPKDKSDEEVVPYTENKGSSYFAGGSNGVSLDTRDIHKDYDGGNVAAEDLGHEVKISDDFNLTVFYDGRETEIVGTKNEGPGTFDITKTRGIYDVAIPSENMDADQRFTLELLSRKSIGEGILNDAMVTNEEFVDMNTGTVKTRVFALPNETFFVDTLVTSALEKKNDNGVITIEKAGTHTAQYLVTPKGSHLLGITHKLEEV